MYVRQSSCIPPEKQLSLTHPQMNKILTFCGVMACWYDRLVRHCSIFMQCNNCKDVASHLLRNEGETVFYWLCLLVK